MRLEHLEADGLIRGSERLPATVTASTLCPGDGYIFQDVKAIASRGFTGAQQSPAGLNSPSASARSQAEARCVSTTRGKRVPGRVRASESTAHGYLVLNGTVPVDVLILRRGQCVSGQPLASNLPGSVGNKKKREGEAQKAFRAQPHKAEPARTSTTLSEVQAIPPGSRWTWTTGRDWCDRCCQSIAGRLALHPESRSVLCEGCAFELDVEVSDRPAPVESVA